MERVPSLLGERFGELNLGAAIPLPERMELVDLDKESACLVGEGGPVETFQLAVALQAIEDPLCLGRDPRLGGEVMIGPPSYSRLANIRRPDRGWPAQS